VVEYARGSRATLNSPAVRSTRSDRRGLSWWLSIPDLLATFAARADGTIRSTAYPVPMS
jgi:hypothetical protein